MIDLSNASSDEIADWIEILSASQSGQPLSIQRVQDISERFANLSQNLLPFAFKQLERRSQILGKNYPFLLDESLIVTRKSVIDSVYIQLLFLTSGTGISTSSSIYNLDKASKLFEDIAESSLKSFFGENTETVNFGFPSRRGRPAEFSAAVEWLSNMTNIRLGNAYRPPRKKDGGVDLFVWKSFSDNNPGIPVMLVQCTIKEDFINKIGDIDIKLWSSWLSSDIEPLVALAVPGIVNKNEIWSEIATRGILLDRLRLVEASGDIPGNDRLENADYLEKLVFEMKELVH